MKDIRLTQMVKSAGCAAKLFPDILTEALKDLKWTTNENVLVNFEGKDDAGVYKLNNKLALIHTTDFFTPVVDDPYEFGQIAAANSLSDVYAMGGKPLSALNIVAFPQTENLNILKEIFRGGIDKTSEAGCVIIGGHSIDIPNIVYGLAVTGIINIANIMTNSNAKDGDILILTKALGTGVLNNSVKYSGIDENVYKKLVNSMTKLNKTASELMIKYGANSCTDITGFALAGHSMQMAVASQKIFQFSVKSLPVLDGAIEAVGKNMLTRGDKSNRNYTKDNVVNKGKPDKIYEHLLYDPQTSGGLLISVPEKNSKKFLEELIDSGDDSSKIVGFVLSDAEYGPGTIVFDFD